MVLKVGERFNADLILTRDLLRKDVLSQSLKELDLTLGDGDL